MIFYFSSQNAAESLDTSNSLVLYLMKLFEAFKNSRLGFIVGDLSVYAFRSFIRMIIRKTAHFVEFFILYIIVYENLKEYIPTKAKVVGLAIAIACGFLDEFHQLFVYGRAASFIDCLIDGSGCLLAYFIWHHLFKK